MRTLRNSLSQRPVLQTGVLALALGFSCAVAAEQRVTANSPATVGQASYFPLAVGNYWTYRCSVEGEYQFDKTVRLMSVSTQNDIRYFRAELRMRKDPKPLVYYLSADADGVIFSVPKPGHEGREPLIPVAPKAGERVGEWIVAGSERISTPALAQVEAIRLENFARDDPQLPAERRAEWRGRYYARGVGLVAEADGLGGDCALTKYRVQSR